jgi:PAS domain-containing protein
MTSSQRILTILAIVLLAFLAGLTVWANWVPAPPVLAVLPLIPLTAVLILAAMFGRLAALCGGLVYGLAVTLVLLPDHLSVLPLSREFGAALLQPLALANYLAAPLLGFLAGSGARLRQARQRQLRRKIDELSRANQDMRSHIADHERTLATLSQSRLYKKAWTDLIDESGESESLIGLFLTVLLNQRRRRRHAGLIAPDATPPCRDITFSHLIDLTCPDILAVLQLDGTIHAVNARLFAIFCYPADTPLIGRSVTDLLVPEDAPRALANIARAVGSDFDSGETYDIRASDGRFQTLVVSPHVYLECLGDPLVLALRVASSQGSAADKPEPARPDPIALAELQVWCLSADRLTLYISPDLAGRLSESAALMLGKPIDHYLIRKQAARFHDFMASCQDGQSHTIDLVMRPHKGDRTILSLTAWPAIGAQGHLLGLTLLARDITERRIVEEALQHRLAIEQMISAFSTRFISIKADAMDQEIREVVRRIGAFEEAIETTVEIYRSGKISICNRQGRLRQTSRSRRQSRCRLSSMTNRSVISASLSPNTAAAGWTTTSS